VRGCQRKHGVRAFQRVSDGGRITYVAVDKVGKTLFAFRRDEVKTSDMMAGCYQARKKLIANEACCACDADSHSLKCNGLPDSEHRALRCKRTLRLGGERLWVGMPVSQHQQCFRRINDAGSPCVSWCLRCRATDGSLKGDPIPTGGLSATLDAE